MFPARTERVGHTLGEFFGRTQHRLVMTRPMRLFESNTDRIFLGRVNGRFRCTYYARAINWIRLLIRCQTIWAYQERTLETLVLIFTLYSVAC